MLDRCTRCSAELAEGANYCARCGALVTSDSSELLHDALLGRVLLGRYRVQRLLGEGGMGRVYLAEQTMGQATRPVAIKALRKELIRDPKGSGRFQRESEIVIRLAHPNTIQFYDFAELDDGTPVIVMEYIEGRTLGEVLREGPLSHERTRTLLTQICGSLAEAHAHGFVHRDLKPQNVLLTSRAGHSDFVKVLDFGIALQQADPEYDATRLTTQGTLIGTPPYMSPEQFQAQQVDARSDVYSLGVVAYEMLSGELPFDAKTPWQWAAAHVDQAPRPLSEHASARGLPVHCHDAVMRALSKDPAQRPSDAGALLRDYLGPDVASREEIVLSLTPRPSAQPARDALHVHAALPTAVTERALRPRTRTERRGRWTLTAIAFALLASTALLVVVRHRAPAQPRAQEAELDPAASARIDPSEAKRWRARRHSAEGRSSEPASTDDELSALAARADRLHAIGDPSEVTAKSALVEIGASDELAKLRAAIEGGDVPGAGTLLATLQHRPDVDSAALAALVTRLSETVEESAKQLAAARNCAGLSRLSEQLRSASMTAPEGLISGLDICQKVKSSRADAGTNASSDERNPP
jgi:serine/threonine protein kinase